MISFLRPVYTRILLCHADNKTWIMTLDVFDTSTQSASMMCVQIISVSWIQYITLKVYPNPIALFCVLFNPSFKDQSYQLCALSIAHSNGNIAREIGESTGHFALNFPPHLIYSFPTCTCFPSELHLSKYHRRPPCIRR
eukprot:248593_1